jgi:hypothetical protein
LTEYPVGPVSGRQSGSEGRRVEATPEVVNQNEARRLDQNRGNPLAPLFIITTFGHDLGTPAGGGNREHVGQ